MMLLFDYLTRIFTNHEEINLSIYSRTKIVQLLNTS